MSSTLTNKELAMDIRLRAVLHTVGVFVTIFVGSLAIVTLSKFGGIDPALIFTIIISVFLVYTVYELILSRLKMYEEIQKIDERLKERTK
jgi:hypothetical protein